MAARTGLLGRYCNLFPNARRPHRWCSRIIEAIKRHGSEAEFEEMRDPHKRYREYRLRYSPKAFRSVHRDSWCNGQTPTFDQVDRSSLTSATQSAESCRTLLVWSPQLDKTLREFRTQAFDNLSESEVTFFSDSESQPCGLTVLALPGWRGNYNGDTDLCANQIGCVGLKKQLDGADGPTGYCFSLPHDADRAYETTNYQCLSEVWAVLQLRMYLYGDRFDLCTDREAV